VTVVPAEQDVAWLHVAVNDAIAMELSKGDEQRAKDGQRAVDRQGAFAREDRSQRFAVDELHRDAETVVDGLHIVDSRQVRAVHVPGESDLAPETLQRRWRDAIGAQDLERDGPAQLVITRFVDDRRAADTGGPDDLVAPA
jgi:hypothetical protein